MNQRERVGNNNHQKPITMKTVIEITGQPSGNSRLRNAIGAPAGQEERTCRYGYRLTYQTKQEARRALWVAYKRLRWDNPESLQDISYSSGGPLCFDASRAELVDTNTAADE